MSARTSDLELQGYYGKDGDSLERLLPIDNWNVPGVIDLDLNNEMLVWRIQNEKGKIGRWVTSSRGLLEEFIQLQDGSATQILGYAQKWGVLQICRDHKVPASHTRQHPADLSKTGFFNQCELDWQVIGGAVWYQEPLHIWRKFAVEARMILQLSASLRSGELGNDADWKLLSSETDLHTWLTDPEKTLTQKLVEGKLLIAAKLEDWLSTANVSFEPGWGTAGPTIRFGNKRLFGALALQLMTVAFQTNSFLLCCNCTMLYFPRRVPRLREQNYCPSCRERGIPQSRRSRKYYHSKVKPKKGKGQPNAGLS